MRLNIMVIWTKFDKKGSRSGLAKALLMGNLVMRLR